MTDCMFCKIERGEVPARIVYQDAELFAFEDLAPQAPTHILICPRRHFASLNEATAEDTAMLGRIQLVAAQLAGERGIASGHNAKVGHFFKATARAPAAASGECRRIRRST